MKLIKHIDHSAHEIFEDKHYIEYGKYFDYAKVDIGFYCKIIFGKSKIADVYRYEIDNIIQAKTRRAILIKFINNRFKFKYIKNYEC